MSRTIVLSLLPLWILSAASLGFADEDVLQPEDVFELEWASQPTLSPDGDEVVFLRNFMDIMKDRRRSNLWRVDFEGGEARPITTGLSNVGSPLFSPDGTKLLYTSNEEGGNQIWVRWLETGETAKLTQLQQSPSGLSWSPDGSWIAFSQFVPDDVKPFATMPKAPKGADWAPAPKAIDALQYRSDGRGYLEQGHSHVFLLSADGGTPRQITSGPYDHGGTLSWMPDSSAIVLSANRDPGGEYNPQESDLYRLTLATRELTRLTNRKGPDGSPTVSPDGRQIAYLGNDDHKMGYHVTRLNVMNADGTGARVLTSDLDRDAASPTWSPDGKGIYFQYDDRGDTKLAWVSLDGERRDLANQLGGESLGRPYAGGSFSVAKGGRFAFTKTSPMHPSDVAVGGDGPVRQLTALNDDLFRFRRLGAVEEIWYTSSFDGRRIQGWLVTPPGFDPAQQYPMILEIHGGPFANYGNRFAAEIQLFAAAGYVVLYTNPRGSTSYGDEFANLIHHNYPGQDYDDLMSGVDAVLERGFVDPDRLFVTGGSGGGVLTAWIVGKTDRFRAAVVAKPVINWISFSLTADAYPFFYQYWFPGLPWDEPEHYFKRSPLSLVGNVSTPTMLLTGEADYRTPISESEQFYQALKLRQVDTMMVRIPEASHGIAARPSHLIAKVAYILAWFEKYRGETMEEPSEAVVDHG
ncbi:MAG: S9 family peptidase [Planctomycetota bacterium]